MLSKMRAVGVAEEVARVDQLRRVVERVVAHEDRAEDRSLGVEIVRERAFDGVRRPSGKGLGARMTSGGSRAARESTRGCTSTGHSCAESTREQRRGTFGARRRARRSGAAIRIALTTLHLRGDVAMQLHRHRDLAELP